jgi:hypothetical protein
MIGVVKIDEAGKAASHSGRVESEMSRMLPDDGQHRSNPKVRVADHPEIEPIRSA